MTASDRASKVPVRIVQGVLCVRVPDSAPPLLEICRCACCGGLRRVELGGDYICTDGNTRSPNILKG